MTGVEYISQLLDMLLLGKGLSVEFFALPALTIGPSYRPRNLHLSIRRNYLASHSQERQVHICDTVGCCSILREPRKYK